MLSLHADGSNPLISVAPAINADLNLYLEHMGNALRCLACGDHDGFPAYELYVNGMLIYCHDPIAGGKSPFALFPPSDINVNTGWIDIQLATGQILSGQICKEIYFDSFIDALVKAVPDVDIRHEEYKGRSESCGTQ